MCAIGAVGCSRDAQVASRKLSYAKIAVLFSTIGITGEYI